MIRVLRVLEYEYDTAEDYVRDIGNWTLRLGRRNAVRHRMQSSTVSVTTTNGEIIDDIEAPQ